MSVATLPCDAAAPAGMRWSDGAAEVGFARIAGATRLRHLFQSDPCRVLFPRPPAGAPPEAAIVTTSGGIVGGDRLRIALNAGPGVQATVTTQAAEKIYRSAGATAEIEIALSVAAGATLEWMPQETILFDRARLRRMTEIDLAADARLLAGEIVVFGRLARGERFRGGLLHDGWRVRCAGALLWADALHLGGDGEGALDEKFAFNGAVALATALYAGPDAARRLDDARAFLGVAGDGCAAAASCLGPLLVIRLLGHDAEALRQRYARFWSAFRAAALDFPAALPRVWHT